MAKEFNRIADNLTATDNKITVSDIDVGYTALLKCSKCVGTWVGKGTTVDSSDVTNYGGTFYQITGWKPTGSSYNNFTAIRVGLNNYQHPSILLYDQNQTEYWYTNYEDTKNGLVLHINSGDDSRNAKLYEFLSKHFTKQ